MSIHFDGIELTPYPRLYPADVNPLEVDRGAAAVSKFGRSFQLVLAVADLEAMDIVKLRKDAPGF